MRSQDPSPLPEPQRGAGAQSFHRLLSSPEYERLRGKLIRIFARRGCQFPQDLADETIARVAEKMEEIAPTFQGDPSRYFYGVARNVYLEHVRRPKTIHLDDNRSWKDGDDGYSRRKERTLACLEQCLSELPTEERRLIYEYYRYDKSDKIHHRKALAAELGVGLNALRIKAYRIRRGLYRCVASCSNGDMEKK